MTQTLRINDFFNYLQLRLNVQAGKAANEPWPWCDDEIMQRYRFCNVFREDDKTTKWLRENIRSRFNGDNDVVWATIAFRWFNRIETAEELGALRFIPSNWHKRQVETTLRRSGPPWTTGSYIIKTPNGMDKLAGVLWCIDNIPKTIGSKIEAIPSPQRTMNIVWDMLREYPYIGAFMSYEIVTDLRYTHILDKAPDKMTWANPGPGAVRGWERLTGYKVNTHNRNSPTVRHEVIDFMRELLKMAPDEIEVGSMFEMREIEHGLCEFDKYERVRLGEGAPRQLYRPPMGGDNQ